jgi:hypothetical protein
MVIAGKFRIDQSAGSATLAQIGDYFSWLS